MSKPTIIGVFEGKCCDAAVVNNNDMHLGQKLFDNLFASEEYKRAIKNRHYIGFLGHPEDPGCQDYEHACITMTECHREDDDIVGKFDLINTPVGQVVKSFIDAGVNFGISIRGAGDVDTDGEVDPDTFVFRGFDLVTFPAYDDCIPEFREIAASTDVNKQKKFKKVCASIEKNLKSITSCNALEVIKEQFPEGSDEYNLINDRILELQPLDEQVAEDVVEVALTPEETIADLTEKLAGVTDMYTDLVAEYQDMQSGLTEQVNDLAMKAEEAEVLCHKKIAAFKRIAATQIVDLEKENDRVTASVDALTEENRKLKKEKIQASKKIDELNLKYKRKVDANSDIISRQDSTIENLKSKLNETVVASKGLKSRASNLDVEVKELRQRVEAAEQMVLSYQQAYANMYANTLGVHLDNIPVCATTSVEELKGMITAGTSTCNIPAKAAIADVDDFDDEEFDFETDGVSDMVTL